MSGAARATAIIAVLCIVGAAGCAAAPSLPSLTSRPSPTPRSLASVEASPAPSAGTSASPRAPDGLAAEIEVQRLDPNLAHSVLEFASDGVSIVFSSGMAEDAEDGAAPDLWRYTLGPSDAPELIWRNPSRDHSIVKLDGDVGTLMFVDIPLTGESAWDLWLIPETGAEPILLDAHPGDDDVSSLVPSFSISEDIVAWTAFDRGPAGAVSRLLVAEPPEWEPRVIVERLAAEAELWLPSLYGYRLVYTEVRYSADRSTDERSVHYLEVGGVEPPRRLDTSGRATMPLLVGDAVYWKEADPGFNMFNWGHMFRYELATGEVSPVSVWPQEYVNYPSAGTRFLAWRGADSFKFGVYDMVRGQARLIESYSTESQANVLRPHIRGDLMVWMYVETPGGGPEYDELRWAFLPNKSVP